MTPPFYKVCAASPAVKTLLGTTPRIYPWGESDDPLRYPYVTFLTDGQPGNYLQGSPDSEAHSLSVDVWAQTPASADAVVAALRAAIEPHGYVQAVRQMGRDPQTKSCRVRLEVDWTLV